MRLIDRQHVLLVEGPADPLGNAALDLALDMARMDRPADILSELDYLAVKMGIGEAARRDPVGVRVRSPSQKTPQNNSRSPQRSVNQKRPAPAQEL
jgi:hypothetical protein